MHQPETLTVRGLIKSVTKLANHLGLTNAAIYRWINVNRIPGTYVLKIAQFYDMELTELLPLCSSDKKNERISRHVEKPRQTLPVCLQVQRGEISIDEAASLLDMKPRTIQIILTNWADDLVTLYNTLEELERKEISLDQAALRLRVTKYNIHALRKKYGYRPEPRKPAQDRPIVQRRKTAVQVALSCISGKYTLDEAEKASGMSWRTIHRAIAKVSPGLTLQDLTHWPRSFRLAYATEIEHNLPKISEKLWDYAETCGISLKKWPKYPEKPQNWRSVPLRRTMFHVLNGDESLHSVAEKRGADPNILASLFTSDLRPLGLTWAEVSEMPINTQGALAELLLAIDDSSKSPRMRKIEQLEEQKQ